MPHFFENRGSTQKRNYKGEPQRACMGYKVEEELNEDAIITLSIQNKKSKDEHTHTNDLNNLFAVLENKKQE